MGQENQNTTVFNAVATAYSNVKGTVSLPTEVSKIKDAYFAFRTEEDVKEKNSATKKDEKKKKYTFEKTDRGIISKKLYVVVETEAIKDKNIKISVCSAKNKVLTNVDASIKLLYGEDELEEKELSANNYFNDSSISSKNQKELDNKTIFEITLQPKSDDDKKKWVNALSNSTDKKASLYIKVEVAYTTNIVYDGKGDGNKCFLYEKPFELFRCYCNRDITGSEMKQIIIDVRKKTSYTDKKKKITKSIYDWGHKEKLFANASMLDGNEKNNYDKFVESFNFICTKYEINTCIRKIHFLAQTYHESGYFSNLSETGKDAGTEYELKTWEDRKLDKENQIKRLNEIDKRLSELSAKTVKTEEEKTEEKKLTTEKSEMKTKKQYEDELKKAEKKIEYIQNMGNTEYGDGKKYRGRGLIQTTWRSNYIKVWKEFLTDDKYKEKLKKGITQTELENRTNNYEELLEKHLLLAFAASGYYWKSTKDTKTLFNLNEYSDNDSIFDTSRLVNLPIATKESQIYAIEERKGAYNILKELFYYPDQCNSTVK